MTIVIQNARLIDGNGGAPLEGATVVIEGHRISAVGQRVPLPAGEYDVIDAEGRTVMPALMDLHALMPYPSFEEILQGIGEKEAGMILLRAVANGRRCLNAGVTTVRIDMCPHHGLFALREAFASGLLDGPRLFVPGRALTMTGGHAWALGMHEADGPDEMRKAARQELKAGADWIKLMASGGAGSPTERPEDVQLTAEEMKAAVEEAHKKGKFAYAHVSSTEAARNCLAAHVDSIEHGIDLDDDVLQEMKERGVFLIPTLGIYRRMIECGERAEIPDDMYRKAQKIAVQHRETFRRALQIGVKMAAGTDSGQDWYVNGESLLYELELMNQEGMAPMDVLVAATRRGAECLRIQQDLGTLESGKLADILIVDGDPLANVSALRNTWMVMKEGRVVFRQ